jgi:maleamate amidohydrolase
MTERVWDKYLTSSDKEHVQAFPRTPVGVGAKPALLMVDFYRAVFGDKPEPLMQAVKTWPASCGMAGWNALPHVQKLLAAARAAKIPVVHITMLADSGMVSWSDAAHRDTEKPGKPLDAAALDRKSRSAEIITELAPIEGETVLRKTAPSSFWGTPLAGHLTYLGIDTLIVAGESTSGCVRASVVEAVAHRYRVQVVEECVFDRHEATHALNLFDMHQKYADVVPLDVALQYIATKAPKKARISAVA